MPNTGGPAKDPNMNGKNVDPTRLGDPVESVNLNDIVPKTITLGGTKAPAATSGPGAARGAAAAPAKAKTKEQVTLSQEAMSRVRRTLLRGDALPPDAPRDELMAYHRLSRDITRENLREREELKGRR